VAYRVSLQIKSKFYRFAGGTMNPSASIYFGNGGQNISQGSFDNGLGGSKGISLTCTIGYELYVPPNVALSICKLESMVIGEPYELAIGQSGNANFIAGDDGGGAYLKSKTGGEGVGKVWTSDQSGWGSWTHTLDDENGFNQTTSL